MSSSNFDVPTPPPEALELLKDPRLSDMKFERPGFSGSRRVLAPKELPVEGESRYLLLHYSMEEASDADVNWLNEPFGTWGTAGKGFSFIKETPMIVESCARPKQLRDAWDYSSWIIASPRFAEIVRSFEPEVTQTVPIDWTFSDGKKLDGYVFLDICRLVHAYDYDRSDVKVEAGKSAIFITGCGQRRALKSGINPTVHAFREAFCRSDTFVSRELAQALFEAGIREVDFRDPATMNAVSFK